MKKIVSLLFFTFLLSGCVGMYAEPSQDQSAVPLATVSGNFTRNGLFNWKGTSVTSIDNKSTAGLFSTSNSKYKVTPGTHLFVVNTTFLRTMLEGQNYANIEIVANVRPGMDYHFNSAVSGAHINAWLEDQTGHRVSQIGSEKYQIVPVPETTYVYMPAKH